MTNVMKAENPSAALRFLQNKNGKNNGDLSKPRLKKT